MLMNIPYAELYAADTTNNNVQVDVFTSATVSKSQTGRLSGGSYGGLANVKESDGKKTTEISGAQFPVKVSAEAAEKLDWSKFTQVTDSTTQDVTTTNRGQTSTTTYTGKQALFCMGDYAYYQLSKEPSYYKELTADENGNIQLSEVKGAAPTEVSATAEFTTETSYGDYELDLDAETVEKYFNHESDFIYTVLINAQDESGKAYSYGLRPLENVWLGSELAWCSTPLVSQVHGCPTSYEHYASLMGKTIKSVTYYTEKGAYTFNIDDAYVPVKVSADKGNIATQESASIDDASAIGMNATLPEGFDAQYTIEGWSGDVEVTTAGSGSYSNEVKIPTGTQPGEYTIVATDKSGKYAPISASFTLTTTKAAAAFDASALKLAAADGASVDDFANYLGNISQVTVNGVVYNAQGKGAVKIFNADGSLNLAAANRDGSLVFAANGAYDIKVVSTGYANNLEFTYAKVADKDALEAAIDSASKIENNGVYTSTSWEAFQQALEAAQGVDESVAATDEDVESALAALQSAQAGLAKTATTEQNSALRDQIEAGKNLKESDYTAESWAAYQAALSKANDLIDNADASGDDVEAATAALKQARESLAKPTAETPAAGEQGSGETPTTGSPDTGSANGATDGSSNGSSLATTGDAAPLAATGAAALGAAVLAAVARFMRRRTQN